MEETKKERIIQALKDGMTPMEIGRAEISSKAMAYRYKRELKEQGYEFTTRKSKRIRREPKNEYERLQFKNNKIVLDIQAETGLPLKDLRLTENNDPYCLILSAVRTGKVMAKIWEDDGWREKYDEWVELGKPMDKESARRDLLTHPRGLHYKIHGCYKIEKDDKTVLYNKYDDAHWRYCLNGIKFARQMGLIPYDAIKDLMNPPPDNIPYYKKHNELEIPTYIEASNDVMTHDFNTRFRGFSYKHIGKTIKWKAEEIAKIQMKSVKYYTKTAQPNHLELWCEKGEIIPFDIARKYNMEIRERGSGQPSDMMCYDAIMKAKANGKSLVVFEVSDFDPEGENMPFTLARKIQWYANREGVQAFVYPVALLYKQIKEYGLPYNPPSEDIKYEKAYATRSSDFYKRWNMVGMMINVFKGENLEGLKHEIENAVIPHYDAELSDKLDDAKEELRINIERTLRKSMRRNIHELKNKRKRVIHKKARIKHKTEQQNSIKSQCEALKETGLEKYKNLDVNMTKKYKELVKGFKDWKDNYIEALRILKDAVIEEYGELVEPYKERRERFWEATDILGDKIIESCNEKRDKIIEELEHIKTKKENRIEADIKKYEELLQIDLSEVLEGVEFKMPEADISKGEDALLNTNRGYIEQLEIFRKYKERSIHDQNVNNTGL